MAAQPSVVLETAAGRVAVVGAAIAAEAPAGAERIDLGDACVLPGFTDAHVHFPSWALGRRELRLFGARSLPEALDLVSRAAPGEGWLRGRGWRDETWPAGEAPTRAALDAVTGERPAALRSHDGHSLWLNSAALTRGVPSGEVVERDGAGEPIGILREEAAWAFFDAHAAASFEETLAAMRDALPAAAGAGVTGVHDKDGGRGAPELFAALREAGELTLNVWQSVPEPDPARGDYVKAFMDGALGSRTALLLDGSGVQITSAAELAEIVIAAARAGMPVAVHAIGDLANREALDAFEATEAVWRPRGLRHRIEHAQCVHPDDVARFARLGIAASVQYTHATSDRDLVERIWGERVEHAYPYRSLRDAGVLLAGGSDAPVEELAPLDGLRAAVHRSADGRPPWRPEQAIGVADALASFTTAPAWLEGAEDRRGRLQPGFAADLVVLDRDPRAVAPEELAGLQVLATMAAGRWVHGAP